MKNRYLVVATLLLGVVASHAVAYRQMWLWPWQ